MVKHCLQGDFVAARKLNDRLIDAYDIMFAENNPAGVKAFLSEFNCILNVVRLPVVPLTEALTVKVRNYIAKNK